MTCAASARWSDLSAFRDLKAVAEASMAANRKDDRERTKDRVWSFGSNSIEPFESRSMNLGKVSRANGGNRGKVEYLLTVQIASPLLGAKSVAKR